MRLFIHTGVTRKTIDGIHEFAQRTQNLERELVSKTSVHPIGNYGLYYYDACMPA